MELDIEDFKALSAYMVAIGRLKPGDSVSLKKLAGGVSNRTVKVTWPDGHGWVLKQALAKLRVEIDWYSNPGRIEVEARALRWFNRWVPRATPAFIFEDLSNHLMGMDAIPDEHENWKLLLLAGQIVDAHFEQFGSLLGTVHRQSSENGAEVRAAFADTTYFETLRLEPYYLYTAENVSAASAFIKALARDTLHHKYSLVHGDFSPKNTLIYRDKLILLDYEVTHFGDPAFDVGFALTHFLSKSLHLPVHRHRLASATSLFWEVYKREIERTHWAGSLEPRVVRHTLACLLARVAGKSPLEYLSNDERAQQKNIALELIARPPANVADLIGEFVQKADAYAED
jgi:5-methylthioribose kinase